MKMTPKTGTNERRAWRLIAVLTSMWLWQAVVHGQEPASGGEAVFELEAYNVYAAATESAIVKKRESDTVGSYLGADSLADLPDDDLGEALSRLAGVNVVGGGGTSEANVTIRGAEGQYNTIRINGALQANARLVTTI
jgi:outer membrane receptor for ferrienterochelin and colicin